MCICTGPRWIAIHQGESYYEAAADELTSRGYPTRSVFNWRTPLPMWLLGMLPAFEIGKAIIGFLAVAVILLAFEALAREQKSLRRPHRVCVVVDWSVAAGGLG